MTQQTKTLSKLFADWSTLSLRMSLRLKITLPYIILAILMAIAGALVITQLVVDSVQERFVNQLLETGRLVADQVVQVEQDNLATLRVAAYTDGIPQALQNGDTETLRELVYPVAVNNRIDIIELLDLNGIAQLSLRHQRAGSATDYETVTGTDFYTTQPLVQRVLAGEQDQAGDKFADLISDASWGTAFYIAGPVFLDNELVGVILVGNYLDQLATDLRLDSGAHHITIYASSGQPLITTFSNDTGTALDITPAWYDDVINQQEDTQINTIQIDNQQYSQAFLPFEARHGSDMGVMSIALSQGYLVHASPVSRLSLTLIIVAALLGVLSIGTMVARHITRPVLAIAHASRNVAQGDLSQQVEVNTRDEVGDLADAFNAMVGQLRLAETVKDIFGRAVSPEVSAALIKSVSNGEISLGGENRMVSILFSDIKSFTTFSEQHTAGQVVAMLNEFVTAIYPAITKYGGVINKFGGDSTLAMFGAPVHQPDHARRAVLTGLAMQQAVVDLNTRRLAKNQVPIYIGVGINTGDVVVGTVGTDERLEYTMIGDPVNAASRIEGLTRRFKRHDILISQATLDAIGPEHLFSIELDWNELDTGTVSTELHEQFQEHNEVLTPQALVEVKQVGNNWTIVDGDKKYLIRNENQTLNVYGPDHGLVIEDLGLCEVKGKTSQVHIYSVLRKKRDA
ncbi:MAG: HAMP domain-containing protein [Chloroflexi bacterium]|nr:HAMP domain-containing protein [Chloroflexota bacterium]